MTALVASNNLKKGDIMIDQLTGKIMEIIRGWRNKLNEFILDINSPVSIRSSCEGKGIWFADNEDEVRDDQ
jgi:hypothetical protein